METSLTELLARYDTDPEGLCGMNGTPVFHTRDGGVVCRPCAIDNASIILDAERDGDDPEWTVWAVDNADDYAFPIQCDNCYAIVGGATDFMGEDY